MPEFTKTLTLPHISPEELFAWHAREGAFQRLTTPWQKIRIVEHKGSITNGSILKFRIYQGPLPVTWEAHHDNHIENKQFQDIQKRGPFRSWRHTHRFDPSPEGGVTLTDHIEYTLPVHPLSAPLAPILFEPMLERMFNFRHARTRHDMTRHQKFKDAPRQTIAISGASGLVGEALTHFLTTGGHEVRKLTRSASDDPKSIHWDIKSQSIDAQKLEGVDVVIHLAGEPINQRWTDEAKERVLQSRKQGTALLAQTIAKLDSKPRVFISASAVGFYGNGGSDIKTYESSAGSNFLAQVCTAWEESTRPANEAGIRVVNSRFGVILSAKGGALEQMLTPFKMGVGGRIGDGKQYMSWIAMDDVLGALYEAIFNEEIQGPMNVTAPEPVTNEEFTKVLGDVLNRPTLLPVPNFGLYALVGKKAAKELLLEGQRAVPKKLQQHGFEFEYADLEHALRHTLGR